MAEVPDILRSFDPRNPSTSLVFWQSCFICCWNSSFLSGLISK